MIQLKGGGKVRDERRRKAWKAFRCEIFWLQAVGEKIFGALNTRLNERLWNLRLFCTQ
jgi:hypothetical protein